MLLRRDCALSPKVLEGVLCVQEGVPCVLELLGGVRRVPKAVENCVLYAVSTAGDVLCAEVVEVVPKVLGGCAKGT